MCQLPIIVHSKNVNPLYGRWGLQLSESSESGCLRLLLARGEFKKWYSFRTKWHILSLILHLFEYCKILVARIWCFLSFAFDELFFLLLFLLFFVGVSLSSTTARAPPSVFAGAFAHMFWSPQRAALGASGGLMGLYGFLWSYHQRRGESAQVKTWAWAWAKDINNWIQNVKKKTAPVQSTV
jgi:hypothetical protein